MRTSLGIWALGPMITRFVPGGYQPEHANEPMPVKVRRAVEGLGDLMDDYEFHYPGELNPDNLDEVRAALDVLEVRDHGLEEGLDVLLDGDATDVELDRAGQPRERRQRRRSRRKGGGVDPARPDMRVGQPMRREFPPVRYRRPGIEIEPAVGERVGSDVHHPHHFRV